MGENEDASAAFHLARGEVREDDGLPAPRRKDDQAGRDLAKSLFDCLNGLFLVGTERHS